ncbi:hypothetical protein CcNV_025 [Crangon crangon nudivirus]|uniref:Uncharacterized protein n=1 Tax=Crangon crangon nudivirus TaxID=2880838 RepID=A0AAE8Y214_9VIRU|nr:hypothetical protein QKT25_gp025 [Crangon crangon nudivirus]UBZ25509.1 hypothetical protein CcNV_025 [Crangon crangon nudivirus]
MNPVRYMLGVRLEKDYVYCYSPTLQFPLSPPHQPAILMGVFNCGREANRYLELYKEIIDATDVDYIIFKTYSPLNPDKLVAFNYLIYNAATQPIMNTLLDTLNNIYRTIQSQYPQIDATELGKPLTYGKIETESYDPSTVCIITCFLFGNMSKMVSDRANICVKVLTNHQLVEKLWEIIKYNKYPVLGKSQRMLTNKGENIGTRLYNACNKVLYTMYLIVKAYFF